MTDKTHRTHPFFTPRRNNKTARREALIEELKGPLQERWANYCAAGPVHRHARDEVVPRAKPTAEAVRAALASDPSATARDIAKAVGCSEQYVRRVMHAMAAKNTVKDAE